MSYLAASMKLVPDVFVSNYRPAAVLRITGEDALAFLQGQFTQELRHPPGTLCAYGLWLNQKGKVLADSYALRDGQSWWLVSFTSPAALIRERLEAYIIADDVGLEDVTTSWSGVVIGGSGATRWLQSKGIAPPPLTQWASIEGGLFFRGRRGLGESWEWLSPMDNPFLNQIVGDDMTICDASILERKRILAGVPAVPKDVGSGDLPNEGGLELEAISYTKGCYLGQEVMARLKSMGQVRRQLMRVKGKGPLPPSQAALYVGVKKVGEIRSVVNGEEDDTFIGLAMISLLAIGPAARLSLEVDDVPVVEVFRGAV